MEEYHIPVKTELNHGVIIAAILFFMLGFMFGAILMS